MTMKATGRRPPDEGRAGRRRARRVLAAVPRPAAAAAALGRAGCPSGWRHSTATSSTSASSPTPRRAPRPPRSCARPDCDLIVGFLTTYMTASMLLPIAQRSGAPVLLINLQPTEAMDHATFDTGAVAGLLRRLPAAGDGQRLPARRHRLPVGVGLPGGRAGLGEDRPVDQGRRRPRRPAARPARPDGPPVSRHARRLDRPDPGVGSTSAGTWRCWSSTTCGCGSRRSPTPRSTSGWTLAREVFDAGRLGRRGGLPLGRHRSRSAWTGWSRTSRWTAWPTTTGVSTVSMHERLGAGMILGASLLTARGIPAAGEYELRTSLAMLIMDRLGAGGSFTEIQALNFRDGVVEMGHDGPAHLAISARRPLLRGLGVYHGKRGWGVSVEFDVKHGPVTTFGIGQDRDGTLRVRRLRGRGRPRPAAADRQHHLAGRLRPRPRRVGRRLERDRHRPPLGPRHRPPRRRTAAVADLLDIELVMVNPWEASQARRLQPARIRSRAGRGAGWRPSTVGRARAGHRVGRAQADR